MKKLIPALCMLLISAVLLGTSTYAWFSMSGEVSATGMQVKAATDSDLQIAIYNGGTKSAFATTQAVTALAADSPFLKMIPGTPNYTAADAIDGWYVLDDATKANSATDGTVADFKDKGASKAVDASAGTVVLGTTPNEQTRGVVLINKFAIKAKEGSDNTFDKLYVSEIAVTSGTGADAFDPAIRVALKVTQDADTAWTVFAPKNDTLGGTPYTTYVKVSDAVTTCTVPVKKTGIANAENILPTGATISSTKEVTVEVYIWYEGQDAACTSSNAMGITAATSVDIFFASDDPVTEP